MKRLVKESDDISDDLAEVSKIVVVERVFFSTLSCMHAYSDFLSSLMIPPMYVCVNVCMNVFLIGSFELVFE